MGIKKELIRTNPDMQGSLWDVPSSAGLAHHKDSADGIFQLIPAPSVGRCLQIGIGLNPYYLGGAYNENTLPYRPSIWFRAAGQRIWCLYETVPESEPYGLWMSTIILPEATAFELETSNYLDFDDLSVFIEYAERSTDEVGVSIVDSNGTNWVDVLGPPPAGYVYFPMALNGPEKSSGGYIYSDDDIIHGYDVRLYDGSSQEILLDSSLNGLWPYEVIYFYNSLPVLKDNWRIQMRLGQAENTNPARGVFPYVIKKKEKWDV